MLFYGVAWAWGRAVAESRPMSWGSRGLVGLSLGPDQPAPRFPVCQYLRLPGDAGGGGGEDTDSTPKRTERQIILSEIKGRQSQDGSVGRHRVGVSPQLGHLLAAGGGL